MKEFNVKASLFVLSEAQQQQYMQWHHYEIYFGLLRHEFLHTPYALLTMADFTVFYYYDAKELPIINSENALLFLLRNSMLDIVMKNQKLQRLKMMTKGNSVQSLIAAAATTNIFLDGLREVFQQLTKEEVDFFSKYANNIEELYDQRFINNDGYPKRLVLLETFILKQLGQWIYDNNELFMDSIQQAIRMMDEISIIERELFNDFQID